MAEANPETGVASNLPDDIRESVAVSNLKAIADQPGVLANLALANAVAAQQQLNTITNTLMGKICESIVSTQPSEGMVDTAISRILERLAAGGVAAAAS